MKKIKYLVPILLFCLFINVKAMDECTSGEINRLRELADKVEFKIDYKIIEDEEYKKMGFDDYFQVLYTINVINSDNDLKIYYRDVNDNDYELLNLENIQNINFYENQKVQFQIYSYTTNLCTNELLKTITLDFPIYNKYFYLNKEKCLKNPDFKYCQEFFDNEEKTTEEIDKLLNDYLNGKTDLNGEITKSNFNIYLILIIVLIFSGLIFVIIKNNIKKDKDLKK